MSPGPGATPASAGAGAWPSTSGAPDAAQGRQHPLALEPGGVGGMVQQDGLAGGGADRTGPRDGVAHQGVDQGGFSGPGGTAHHGQQGRVEAAVPGQDVVIELSHGASGAPGASGPPRAGRAAAGGPRGPAARLPGAAHAGLRRPGPVSVGAHSIIMPVQHVVPAGAPLRGTKAPCAAHSGTRRARQYAGGRVALEAQQSGKRKTAPG